MKTLYTNGTTTLEVLKKNVTILIRTKQKKIMSDDEVTEMELTKDGVKDLIHALKTLNR